MVKVHQLQRRQVRVQAAIDFWPFFYYSVAHSPKIWERIVFSEDEMGRNWLNLLLIGCATLFVPGCGSGQQLVGIQVTPTAVVFGGTDPSLFVQLTATGSYVHPPATKDITNQVTWTSDTVQVAQVTATGKVSPSTNCGTAGITASLLTNSPKGNVITGAANVTVDGPANSGCPTTTP